MPLGYPQPYCYLLEFALFLLYSLLFLLRRVRVSARRYCYGAAAGMP